MCWKAKLRISWRGHQEPNAESITTALGGAPGQQPVTRSTFGVHSCTQNTLLNKTSIMVLYNFIFGAFLPIKISQLVQLHLCHMNNPLPFLFPYLPATLQSNSIFLMLWTTVHLHMLEGCVSHDHWFPLEKAEATPGWLVKLFINFSMSHNGLKVMINSISNDTIASSKKKDCSVQNTCCWSKPRRLCLWEFKNAGTFFNFLHCFCVAQNTTVCPKKVCPPESNFACEILNKFIVKHRKCKCSVSVLLFLRSLHIPLNTIFHRTGMRSKGPSLSATHQTSPEASKQTKALKSSLLQCLHCASQVNGIKSTVLADSFWTFICLGKKWLVGSAYKRPHTIGNLFSLSEWISLHYRGSHYLPLAWEHLQLQFLYRFCPKSCNVSEDHYIEVLLCRLIHIAQ